MVAIQGQERAELIALRLREDTGM
jgi:hypothetical protein